MSHPSCSRCGAPQAGGPQQYPCYQIIKYRKPTNHLLHAGITVVTCFMWLPVWICVAAWNTWGPPATLYVDHYDACPRDNELFEFRTNE